MRIRRRHRGATVAVRRGAGELDVHGVARERLEAGGAQLARRHDVLDGAAADGHVGGGPAAVQRGAGPCDRIRVGEAVRPQAGLLGVGAQAARDGPALAAGGREALQPGEELGAPSRSPERLG